jgi:hypothetical protein
MTKGHIRSRMLGLVVIALLATAVPAAAGSAVERPIREDLVGSTVGMVFSPTFPEGDTFGGRCSQPSQWISTSSGSGVVSHMGQVSWTTEHCFQLFAGTFGDAELVVTAANGDSFYGTYGGVMTGETTFAETMIITGGTGRFTNASGVVAETGWFDPDTGYMEVSGKGWISYDPSDRADH